jgi:hypothetical protein
MQKIEAIDKRLEVSKLIEFLAQHYSKISGKIVNGIHCYSDIFLKS